MKFTTQSGSVYEADLGEMKIRRLNGVKDPTPRQGKDGEWKAYKSLSSHPILEEDLFVGGDAWIMWDPANTPPLSGDGIPHIPYTQTSSIVSIEED